LLDSLLKGLTHLILHSLICQFYSAIEMNIISYIIAPSDFQLAATAASVITLVESSVIDGDSIALTTFKLELGLLSAKLTDCIVSSLITNGKLSMMAVFILSIVFVPIGGAIAAKAEELSNDCLGETISFIASSIYSPFSSLLPSPLGDIIETIFEFGVEYG